MFWNPPVILSDCVVILICKENRLCAVRFETLVSFSLLFWLCILPATVMVMCSMFWNPLVFLSIIFIMYFTCYCYVNEGYSLFVYILNVYCTYTVMWMNVTYIFENKFSATWKRFFFSKLYFLYLIYYIFHDFTNCICVYFMHR